MLTGFSTASILIKSCLRIKLISKDCWIESLLGILGLIEVLWLGLMRVSFAMIVQSLCNYIKFNINSRILAKNNFEKNLYNLINNMINMINNMVVGKIMENV